MIKSLKENWQIYIFLATLIFAIYLFYMIYEFDKDRKEYDERYVKENPEMIAVINTYYDCLDGKVNAIEGCIDYSAKTPKVKDKLIKYNELIKKMKKDKVF